MLLLYLLIREGVCHRIHCCLYVVSSYQDMEQRGRCRSNAVSAGTPDTSRRYRSQSAGRSLRNTSRRISVELPGYLLRGDGWSAYHVFEVRVSSYIQGVRLISKLISFIPFFFVIIFIVGTTLTAHCSL